MLDTDAVTDLGKGFYRYEISKALFLTMEYDLISKWGGGGKDITLRVLHLARTENQMRGGSKKNMKDVNTTYSIWARKVRNHNFEFRVAFPTPESSSFRYFT